MVRKTLTTLGIHGLGDHRNGTWRDEWSEALNSAVPGSDQVQLHDYYLTYDPIFEGVELDPADTVRAFWKLLRSGIGSVFDRRRGEPGTRGRGAVGDARERLRWTAGYIVAWLEDEGFRTRTRELVYQAIETHRPDVLLAHSLGSLIAYNALSHPDADDLRSSLRRLRFVTLGSQIANPFVVRNLTPGRVEALPVGLWYHLYNRHDGVFTAPISLWDTQRFRQVLTPFDPPGEAADHKATSYLKHTSTVEAVWRPIVEERINSKPLGRRRATLRGGARPGRNHRALIVGINRYPDPGQRLDGCVNDAFLMSSVLQECGFPVDGIRLCLDERATQQGILERLEWLLDEPGKGDQRLLYYSGHGATLPAYGLWDEPDRLTETLVPVDFDWSEATAITDDRIHQLYSQLPFDTHFAMILDCCHAGGMHRDGAAKARGIDPPDDIRHRAMRWDDSIRMWVPREFEPFNDAFSKDPDETELYFGSQGCTARLGRAGMLRGLSQSEYARLKQQHGDSRFGPYLPLLIEACAEHELAFEYRHGVESYGAFTFVLAQLLRQYQRISFDRLVNEQVAQRLEALGYQQTPVLLGPCDVTERTVPWL